MNIMRKPKIEEGNKGFLGDLGVIAKLASVIPGPQQPFLAGAGALNDLSARQGSVEQSQNIQTDNGGAMQRRLQEISTPMQQIKPIAFEQDPALESLRRRYGMLG